MHARAPTFFTRFVWACFDLGKVQKEPFARLTLLASCFLWGLWKVEVFSLLAIYILPSSTRWHLFKFCDIGIEVLERKLDGNEEYDDVRRQTGRSSKRECVLGEDAEVYESDLLSGKVGFVVAKSHYN